jgi:hypothetical protein
MHELNLSVNREPVGVYVPKVHEDADHDARFMEVFVFLNFLNNYDTAVGRSNYDIVCVILLEISDRTTEEIYDDTIDCNCDYCETIEWNVGLERTPQYDTDRYNEH